MSATITRNSGPTVPIADIVDVVVYDAPSAVENIIHSKMNGSGFNVTFRPTRLRAGRLSILFADAAGAHDAVALLGTEYTFTLNSDEDEADMTFVVGSPSGSGSLAPRPGEGPEWIVEFPFAEVS
jgi:hypothetical protein